MGEVCALLNALLVCICVVVLFVFVLISEYVDCLCCKILLCCIVCCSLITSHLKWYVDVGLSVTC